MNQKIIGYHLDQHNDWVAELECRHNQHVRHNPPWFNRPWVITQSGRDQHLGDTLFCLKCVNNDPIDNI